MPLNPIKRKYLIEKTAQELNLSVDLVDEIVSFYYSSVQKKMSSAEYHSLTIPRLGTFVIKKKSLDEKIAKSQNFITKIEKDEHISVKTYEMIIEKRVDLEKYLQLKEVISQEMERKTIVNHKKQLYRDGKSN